jgi:hypothetical protein
MSPERVMVRSGCVWDGGTTLHTWGVPPVWRRSPVPARLADLGVVLVLLIAPALLLRPVSDPSPWLHLRVGDFLLGGHRFTSPDPWASFAAHTYQPTQWLPSVVTAKLYEWFGTPVLAWERVAGIAALFLLLLWWLGSLARRWIAVAVAALAMLGAWPTLTERPQLAGFLFLVPVLCAWWRTAHDHRPRWWLVPLTWLAACTHGVWATGGAVAALTTLALVLGRELSRREAARLCALLLACATAGAFTPLGPRLLLTPFQVSSQGRQFVLEWMPSSVRAPNVALTLLMIGLTWVLWIRVQRRPRLWELGWWLVAILLTLSMQRTVPIGAFMAAPLLASACDATLARQGSTLIRLGRGTMVAWLTAAVVGALVAVPVAAARDTQPTGVPTSLTSDVRSLPPSTRVLVNGDTSGWLLFHAPQVEPVFDLRIEAYAPHEVRRYISAVAAEPGWRDYVADTGVTAALVLRTSPISAALQEQLGWTRIGTDAGLVLLEAPR